MDQWQREIDTSLRGIPNNQDGIRNAAEHTGRALGERAQKANVSTDDLVRSFRSGLEQTRNQDTSGGGSSGSSGGGSISGSSGSSAR